MTKAAYRALTLAEGLLFSVLIGLYIWRFQQSNARAWLIFPVWLIASIAVHRDTPNTLGWRADNLWAATRQGLIPFGVFVAALCVVGFLLGAFHRLPAHLTDRRHFFGYFSFCLLQQVALNSYLMNRFLYAVERPRIAALLCSVIFAAMHWPNPVLVPVTLAGGFVMCWLFARERNILPLTLGQAVLGGMAWWAFPIAWHHSMRVGPGYYSFEHKIW